MKTSLLVIAVLATAFVCAPSSAYAKLAPMVPRAIVKINAYSNENGVQIEQQGKPLTAISEPIQTGSGFFINYHGCAMTAAHVVLRHAATLYAYDSFTIQTTTDVAHAPSHEYPAKIAYLDVLRDVGIVCVENAGDMFFHPVDFAPSSYKIDFGDDVYTIGYPLMGGATISYTKGAVMGFWKEPDLLKFLNVDFAKDLSLIKISAIAGPGGSGSPLLNMQDQVLGITFAGSFQPNGAMFALDTTTIGTSIHETVQKMREKGDIPPDCVFDPKAFVYRQSGIAYYDQQCKTPENKNTEQLVQLNYQSRCNANLSEKRLKDAAYTITTTDATLDGWWKYLVELCPVGE